MRTKGKWRPSPEAQDAKITTILPITKHTLSWLARFKRIGHHTPAPTAVTSSARMQVLKLKNSLSPLTTAIALDLIELLELTILVLVSAELIELAYHLYKMRGYCSRIDQHVDKMDSHIMKMDAHLSGLENHMTKIDQLLEKSRENGR